MTRAFHEPACAGLRDNIGTWLLFLGLVAAPVLALLCVPLVGDCIVVRTLGLPCPGCGLGRALLALFHRGDPVAAVASYPPLPALAGGYATGLVALVVHLGAGARSRPAWLSRWLGRWATGCGIVIVCAVLGSWITRVALWWSR